MDFIHMNEEAASLQEKASVNSILGYSEESKSPFS